jgi:hypothetical protein
MGVEPQHAQLLAGLAAMARHRADGADGQAVVTAQQDGHAPALQLGMHGLVHGAVPGHLVQVPIAVHRGQPGVGRAGEVAAVEHVEPRRTQSFGQAGHAHGFGAHGGAARAGADVGGGADQADGGGVHGVLHWALFFRSYSCSSTCQASSAESTKRNSFSSPGLIMPLSTSSRSRSAGSRTRARTAGWARAVALAGLDQRQGLEHSSSVPKPPGKATRPAERIRKCILRSAK